MVESFFMKCFLKVNDDKLSQQYISVFSLRRKNFQSIQKYLLINNTININSIYKGQVIA